MKLNILSFAVLFSALSATTVSASVRRVSICFCCYILLLWQRRRWCSWCSLCANSNVEYVAHVLPTHIFCLKLIKQTQTIRGVAITSSDSVEDANSAFSPVEDTVDTNYLHELVKSARDTAQSIRGVAVISDFVESANGAASPYDDCGQDPLYVDVEFPTGTSLKIVDQHSKCFKFHECKVSGHMISNAAQCQISDLEYGTCETGEIICSFHVVFPGHSDGCDCTIKTTAAWKYHFSASDTCNDCFHIVGIYGSSAVPEGNVWPCGGDGCWREPKMLVMVNPNH